jgi:hypothetical protein
LISKSPQASCWLEMFLELGDRLQICQSVNILHVRSRELPYIHGMLNVIVEPSLFFNANPALRTTKIAQTETPMRIVVATTRGPKRRRRCMFSRRASGKQMKVAIEQSCELERKWRKLQNWRTKLRGGSLGKRDISGLPGYVES